MSANDQIRSMGLSRTISYNSDEGVPKGSPKNLESRLIKDQKKITIKRSKGVN